MALVVTYDGYLEMMLFLRGIGGGFENMGLYKNPLTPIPSMTYADIVEADFGGYAREGLAWSPAFINGDGKGQANAASFTWVTTAPDPQVIYGAFWVNHGGTLMAIDPFDVPISCNVLGTPIPYQPVLTIVDEP